MSLLAVLLYRISHRLWRAGQGDLAHLMKALNMMLTGAEIDHRASIGPVLCVQHPVGVTLGHQLVAGKNLHVFGQTMIGAGKVRGVEGQPKLGDDVTVYARASIFGPVTVGDEAVIGAHALVMRDVPASGVVRGTIAPCAGSRSGDDAEGA